MSFDEVLIDVTSLKFFKTENNNLSTQFRCYNLTTSVKKWDRLWQEITTSKTENKTDEIEIELIV